MEKTRWYQTPRVCVSCKEEFIPHQYNQTKCLFCLRKEDDRFSLERLVRTCAGCTKEFVKNAPTQAYCSEKCRVENSYLTRMYGITKADYDTMEAEQEGKCAICREFNFAMGTYHTGKLMVDHDHDSGKVRGLLCHNCNRGIGLFKDSPEVASAAAQYLQLHGK